MTHSVPTSPPSKAKPEPDSAGYVAGIGRQHGIWYDVEHEIQPLYDAFNHDQRHVALLPVFPASNVCPSDYNAGCCNAIYGCHICMMHVSRTVMHLPDSIYDTVVQNESDATQAA